MIGHHSAKDSFLIVAGFDHLKVEFSVGIEASYEYENDVVDVGEKMKVYRMGVKLVRPGWRTTKDGK